MHAWVRIITDTCWEIREKWTRTECRNCQRTKGSVAMRLARGGRGKGDGGVLGWWRTNGLSAWRLASKAAAAAWSVMFETLMLTTCSVTEATTRTQHGHNTDKAQTDANQHEASSGVT